MAGEPSLDNRAIDIGGSDRVILVRMINRVLGSYRIAEKLGGGGMGVVYVAEHTLIGKLAAVKVLHPEMSTNPDVVRRFFNEAKASSLVKHPGIVDVFDFGYDAAGTAYIIMEYLDGESAGALLQRTRPSIATALAITKQVASAVGAAHAHGIVHRDLKPDNIFLVPEPEHAGGLRIKVLDFGIAKLATEQSNMQATKTGSMLGTPLYMSPEQCRGAGTVDHRADVYALGCVLFELCCGRPPFLGEGVGEIIGAHLHVAPPSPSSLGVSLAPDLEQLILRMISKAPADRPQTMDEVIAAVASSMQLEPASSLPFAASHVRGSAVISSPEALASTLGGSAGEKMPVARRSRRGLLFAALGTIVVAGVIVGVAVTRDSEPGTAASVAAGASDNPPPTPPPTAAAAPALVPAPAPPMSAEAEVALKPADRFDEHLASAAKWAESGNDARALGAAEQALGLRRGDQRAATIAVRAACNLKDSASALRYAKHLSSPQRKKLAAACAAHEIALEPDLFAWKTGETKKWTGAWANAGWQYTFTLQLTRSGLALEGAFLWRLDEAPAGQPRDNVGKSASEFLRGTYEPARGRVRVAGTGMSEPGVIGLDSYELTLAADGLISGKTRTNAGNWTGRISAVLLQ